MIKEALETTFHLARRRVACWIWPPVITIKTQVHNQIDTRHEHLAESATNIFCKTVRSVLPDVPLYFCYRSPIDRMGSRASVSACLSPEHALFSRDIDMIQSNEGIMRDTFLAAHRLATEFIEATKYDPVTRTYTQVGPKREWNLV